MKISASVYSDASRPIEAVIHDLTNHEVDLLHVDCNDSLDVFEDIVKIRKVSKIPIDLHIITNRPEQYIPYLEKHPVEYVTFQHEPLKKPFTIPKSIQSKIGIAITTPTPVQVCTEYASFDFILIMATVPGQSGGTFNKQNFSKIHEFRRLFPNKAVHVDGGVNGEVSFILRNMGVSVSVSGSYLFKGPSVGHALMNLTNRIIHSSFSIADFMTPIAEAPVVYTDELSLPSILKGIDNGKLGLILVLERNSNRFEGIITNADVRRGLLNHLTDFNKMNASDIVNRNPKVLFETDTVVTMLQQIKNYSFPVLYLPVINQERVATGIVSFINLVKGEL